MVSVLSKVGDQPGISQGFYPKNSAQYSTTKENQEEGAKARNGFGTLKWKVPVLTPGVGWADLRVGWVPVSHTHTHAHARPHAQRARSSFTSSNHPAKAVPLPAIIEREGHRGWRSVCFGPDHWTWSEDDRWSSILPGHPSPFYTPPLPKHLFV